MKFRHVLLLFIALPSIAFAQSKSINLGFKNNGIGIGCPEKLNGVRLNLWDKGCGVINGLNISFYAETKKVNGLSLGLLSAGSDTINGIQFGTLFSGAGKLNGISLGGLATGGKVLNGIGIAGLSVAADTLQGLFISGFGSAYWNSDSISIINGVTIGGGCLTKKLNGLSVGIWGNSIGMQKGIAIAIFGNRASHLHGLQIGLINYAGNNKPPFQKLPFINFNFRRDRKD